MRTDIVLTLTGPDRVGIVEEVTRVLLGMDGNVGTSRMARLGGEFSIIMLAAVPGEAGTLVARVEDAFGGLTAAGYRLTVSATSAPVAHIATDSYRIVVRGADHEGIVHEIARGLSERGINIESAETSTVQAPVTGSPLFVMTAIVAVPRDMPEQVWVDDLGRAADAAGVDLEVSLDECGSGG
ncbi:MAG: ACT domain-containing protein [Coriobacteriia bacterium]|nr:ACT domain-containing protein [Coriobacteriia bacterium]